MIFTLLFPLLMMASDISSPLDISPYLELGCKHAQRGERSYVDCTAAQIEKRFSCLELGEVPDYFRSLTPAAPMLECFFEAENISNNESEYVQYKGCGMLPLYSKYLVYYQGEIQELRNKTDVKKFFSPIETPQEALALVSALTGYIPKYEVIIPSGFVKMINQIVPSYTKSNGQNYEVRLFSYKCEGCGNHPYFFVNYEVTRSGDLSELSREDIYRDPKEDNRCQD